MRSMNERKPVIPPDLQNRLRTILGVEPLEDRVVPAWGSVAPTMIHVPTAAAALIANFTGIASGDASIAKREVDWYKFTTTGGAITFSATTPNSDMNPVIGVYNSKGFRV